MLFGTVFILQVGDVIGDIKARDNDATYPNNEILYLLQNDRYGKFKVDITTGRCKDCNDRGKSRFRVRCTYMTMV